LLAPAAAAAGWGRPFRLVQPVSLDVTGTSIAFGPTGTSAVSYTVQNADDPTTARAFMVGRSAAGRISRPQQVRGVQQIFDLAYDGPSLELLAGTSERGEPCCSTAEALRSTSRGGFGTPHKLVTGLAGPALGRLMTLPDRLLAAIATEHGVWVAQSASADHFGSARRLTPSSSLPEALDTTTYSRGRSAVVWTERPNRSVPGPTQLFVSTGQKAAPRGARAVITVPSGHRIDELTVARGRAWPTVAWIESWFDAAGLYHSQAFAADIRGTPRPRSLSSPSELAAGLSFAADARGDQVLAWKGCTVLGTCAVRAMLRSASGRFTGVTQLPPVDASQTPAVAVSPQGLSLVVWVKQGHVAATEARRGARAFDQPRLVSATNYASDITIAFGPKAQALATWTQGTLNQSVIGVSFNAR